MWCMLVLIKHYICILIFFRRAFDGHLRKGLGEALPHPGGIDPDCAERARHFGQGKERNGKDWSIHNPHTRADGRIQRLYSR
jgi:hypothetical protein